MLSPDELETLAVRAASIDERLSGDFVPTFGERSDVAAAEARLAAWCRAAAAGDEAAFARRLARDGLSGADALAKLGGGSWRAGAVRPGWVADAAWVAEALATAGEDRGGVPFSGLFAGVIAAAEARRDESAGAACVALFSEPAREQLSAALARRLSMVGALALYERLSGLRGQWEGLGSIAGVYRAFVDELVGGGWRDVFIGRPVLLRLLAVTAGQWIAATGEMMGRLDADRAALPALLGGVEPGEVVAVDCDLADVHKDGRSVAELVFCDGQAVIYKPKSLSIDAAVAGLVDWLNAHGAPVVLRVPRVIDRGCYGWAERIAASGVADRAAADRFFQRAGGWAALFHVLCATDMHEENLIAAGEEPVPIDLETCLIAALPRESDQVPALAARAQIEAALVDSVVTTGLLPIASGEVQGVVTVGGGLAVPSSAGGFMFGWLDVGGDAMRPVEAALPPPACRNLPQLDGVPACLAAHAAAFEAGLRDYLVFLSAVRGELLVPEGVFAALAAVTVRRVARPTRFYGYLLRRGLDFRLMHDGAHWSAALDFVSRVTEGESASVPWPMVAAERRALLALNVPFFTHAAGGGALSDGSAPIAGVRYPSGFDVVRDRLSKLDTAEIDRQVEIVRLSQLGIGRRRKAADAEGFADVSTSGTPASAVSLAAEVDRIAGVITETAIETAASAAWMGLQPLSDGKGWTFYRIGDDLYSGTAGLAVFLAGHARVRGSDRSRNLALKALAGVIHQISSEGARLARTLGIGVGAGLGGVIYALASVARLLREPALLAPAVKAALLMDAAVIEADTGLDVMDGASGAILGLLRLYRETGLPEVLEVARACGGHLLLHARITSPGGLYLPRHGSRGLAGLSHGASGAALALARLGAVTGERRFAEGSVRFLAYERSLFDAAHGNWPDLRDLDGSGEPGWLTHWCHGAVGIGLARAALLAETLGDAGTRGELVAAAETTAAARQFPDDTLCCGSMGGIALLERAGAGLGRADWCDEARRRFAARVSAAQIAGSFAWSAGGDRENVGLLLGLAGVGQVALQLLAPAGVPDVLTLS